MYQRTSTTSYRQRGFHCPICKMGVMVFGSDQAPTNCAQPNCTGVLAQDWDHNVTQDTQVRDFATGEIVQG